MIVTSTYLRMIDVFTRFDNIDANVLNAGINLLAEECGWRVMYIVDPKCILSCQSGGGCHCIASMSGYDFLVRFESSNILISVSGCK